MGISSCDFINREEGIPAFIAVDTMKLSTITYTEGPNNHSINDVWISVNGDFIGVFELPAEIPVLHEGSSNIFINAGIKNNGIAASRVRYPFYSNVQIDTVLTPANTLVLSPTVSYLSETIFDWYENFQDPGISIDTTSLSDVAITNVNSNGSQVASILLEGDLVDFQARSVNTYEFPEPSTSLYLEMDYICDHEFVVGLFIYESGSTTNQAVMQIHPIEYWNKIYIDLTYISTINYAADNYSVYFAASKEDTTERASIMLDNIKLLHF